MQELLDRLRQSMPEPIELSDHELLLLRAYRAAPNRVPMVASRLCKERDRGENSHRQELAADAAFHRHLHRIVVYNEGLRQSTRSKASSAANVKVSAWSQLGVGFDEARKPLAFVPAPSIGEVVRKARGVVLSLPGRRWSVLLELASLASDGRTVSKRDLIQRLSSATGRSSPRTRVKGDHADADSLRPTGANDTKYLSDTLAELRGDLRAEVDGPDDLAATLLRDAGRDIDLGFVVQALVPDEHGHFTFGQPS